MVRLDMERVRPKNGQRLDCRSFILRRGDKIRVEDEFRFYDDVATYGIVLYREGQVYTIESIDNRGYVLTKENGELEKRGTLEGALAGFLLNFIFISSKRKRLTSDRLPR